jgi:GT2 family glycosyltransferase
VADVSVIIVAWNSTSVIAGCLESVLRQAGTGGLEIIVIDNASNDGTVGLVAQFGRPVRLIQNRLNRGFARAANQGIRACGGQTIVLLNPDASPEPGSINRISDYLSAHPVVGLVGGELINPDGSHQDSVRGFPGLFDLVRRPTSPLRRLVPIRPSGGGGEGGSRTGTAEAGPVDSVAGAFMGIRRRTLNDTGLLDENYFMFVEDMDLCYRARRSGWEVHYLPGVCALHRQGASTRINRRRMVTEHARSMYRFMTKQGRTAPAGRLILSAGLNLYSLIGEVGQGSTQQNWGSWKR